MNTPERPAVSVLVITYNQERYVRQALDSVLMQEADFAFEIIVADDSSRDSTPEIVREYQRLDPRIRVLPSERNVGVTRNYRRGFEACRGEFVAVLEGDDFWISPRKLAVLHAFLREHPECPFCFHRLIRLEEGSEKTTVLPRFAAGAEGPGLLTARQLARKNFIGNVSACMYRHEAVARLGPGLWEMQVLEWPFNIAVARQGPIGYVPEIMSLYRVHPGGVWSGKTAAEQDEELLKIIDAYNEYLGFEFDAEFRHHRRLFLKWRANDSSTLRQLLRRLKPYVPPALLNLHERGGRD